jgi:hypothetical protein
MPAAHVTPTWLDACHWEGQQSRAYLVGRHLVCSPVRQRGRAQLRIGPRHQRHHLRTCEPGLNTCRSEDVLHMLLLAARPGAAAVKCLTAHAAQL